MRSGSRDKQTYEKIVFFDFLRKSAYLRDPAQNMPFKLEVVQEVSSDE